MTSTDLTPPSAPATRRPFAILWFGQFVAVAGLTTVVPILPFYLAGLGVAGVQIPWWTSLALAGPALAQIAAGPLWGWVGDRYGRKAMVVRAQAGLALALGLMALADTAAQFVACRLVQGVFGGVVSANASFASTMAGHGRQGRAFGGLMSATAAGSLVGPLLGSLLAARFGFTALFTAVAVLMALCCLCSLALLPTVRVGIQERKQQLSLGAASAFLVRQRGVARLLLGGLAAQAGVYALVVVFALRVEELSATTQSATVWVGSLQAITWAATLAGGIWWGWRNDRHSPQRSIVYAAVGCALAVALQALPTEPLWFVPLRVLQGFCFAALLPSVQHVVSRVAPEAGRGTCLALTMSVLGFGQVIGPAIGAASVGLIGSPGYFVALGLLFAATALLALGTHDAERSNRARVDDNPVRDEERAAPTTNRTRSEQGVEENVS